MMTTADHLEKLGGLLPTKKPPKHPGKKSDTLLLLLPQRKKSWKGKNELGKTAGSFSWLQFPFCKTIRQPVILPKWQVMAFSEIWWSKKALPQRIQEKRSGAWFSPYRFVCFLNEKRHFLMKILESSKKVSYEIFVFGVSGMLFKKGYCHSKYILFAINKPLPQW